jgi:hypothetical protein
MRRHDALVGYVSGGMNWRPDHTPALMHREPGITRTDLYCSAVKIRGRHARPEARAPEGAASVGVDLRFGYPSTKAEASS